MPGDGWFTIFPYVAAGLGLLALFGRRFATRLVTGEPEESSGERRLVWRTAAWRLGIAGVLGGHLLGLLIPAQVLAWNQHPVRLLVLEVTGLAFASLALYGFAQGLWALRKTSPASLYASIGETVVLTVLATVLVSGTAIAVLYRWGSSWYAATLVPYLYSLLRLAPDAGGVAAMPMLVRLHVLGSFVLMAAVPVASLGAFLAKLSFRKQRQTSVLAAGSEN